MPRGHRPPPRRGRERLGAWCRVHPAGGRAVRRGRSGAGRRRAVRRGHDLLDRLDELRLALLDGRLSEPAVRGPAGLLEERAEPADDPRLRATLEEVELRAAVELAKLERA